MTKSQWVFDSMQIKMMLPVLRETRDHFLSNNNFCEIQLSAIHLVITKIENKYYSSKAMCARDLLVSLVRFGLHLKSVESS